MTDPILALEVHAQINDTYHNIVMPMRDGELVVDTIDRAVTWLLDEHEATVASDVFSKVVEVEAGPMRLPMPGQMPGKFPREYDETDRKGEVIR